ncbi:MAG: hypothetical protein GTO22_25945 [Gemmatimonadales bacterium]|nr:hypothetical protein [Gemmatimonadales bacterium]
MKSMQCLDCGADSHPKLLHPSSLRTEASVWAIAIVIGLFAGIWNTVTSSRASPEPPQFAQLANATAPSAEEPSAAPTTTSEGPRGIVVQVGGWLIDRIWSFLRVAWWVLPIPILFSMWRQFSTHPACAHCGSRRLTPVEETFLGPTG